jgi:hypothetical protein
MRGRIFTFGEGKNLLELYDVKFQIGSFQPGDTLLLKYGPLPSPSRGSFLFPGWILDCFSSEGINNCKAASGDLVFDTKFDPIFLLDAPCQSRKEYELEKMRIVRKCEFEDFALEVN